MRPGAKGKRGSDTAQAVLLTNPDPGEKKDSLVIVQIAGLSAYLRSEVAIMAVDAQDPEYASVEAFVEYLVAEDRGVFTHEDLHALGFRLQRRVGDIRQELASWGLSLGERIPPKRIRGFTTSSNDRWFGPGSEPVHGGGGAFGQMMVSKYGSKDSPF